MENIKFCNEEYHQNYLTMVEDTFNFNSKKETIVSELIDNFQISDIEKLIGILVGKIIEINEETKPF
jgi:hypothetical protein